MQRKLLSRASEDLILKLESTLILFEVKTIKS